MEIVGSVGADAVSSVVDGALSAVGSVDVGRSDVAWLVCGSDSTSAAEEQPATAASCAVSGIGLRLTR
ncbi:MAG: hypothetical protein ACRDP4_07925, partial [Nocardioidaceae bacterium]